jgi:hypothetical protein
MITMTRDQFFEAWREECREHLHDKGRTYGSDLLDALSDGTLVVLDKGFMREIDHGERGK